MNLQLAFYMGFTEVYLIGMDFSYIIPEPQENWRCFVIGHRRPEPFS